jgi:hypothetical protein
MASAAQVRILPLSLVSFCVSELRMGCPCYLLFRPHNVLREGGQTLVSVARFFFASKNLPAPSLTWFTLAQIQNRSTIAIPFYKVDMTLNRNALRRLSTL